MLSPRVSENVHTLRILLDCNRYKPNTNQDLETDGDVLVAAGFWKNTQYYIMPRQE